MTANRRHKRRVRAAAARTGESYTAAKRRLLQHEELLMRTYNMKPAGVTDIGNVRESNEDHLLTEGDLFVVADGMGGGVNGEEASRLAVQVLRDGFAADPTGPGLARAVQDANAAVLDMAAQHEPKTFGTTIAAAGLIDEDGEARLGVVNVGDSRVYLLRDGELRQLSHDHSVVADMVRAGQITETEAEQHPERHRLTQAIGVSSDVDPYQTVVEPLDGDRLLLCSDGLFNEVPHRELQHTLIEIKDPDVAVGNLVARANELGGNDNITAVVVDVT